MGTVVKALKKILAANIGSGVADVQPETELFNDLGLSEQQVDLVMNDLREQFPDADQQPSEGPPRTVGDILQCFEGKLKH